MVSKPTVRRKMFFNVWKRSESDELTRWLAYRFAYKSGPWATQLVQLLDSNDLLALCNFSIDYSLSTDVLHFVNARQCLALFQKNSDLRLGVDKESVAWEAFAKSEIQCRSTNVRFRKYWSGSNTGYEEQLCFIRSKIANILGSAPSLVDLALGFGPGASSTVKIKTTARFKLNADPVCSREARSSLTDLWQTVPNYAFLHKGRARTGMGQLSFVPKNAKTDRSIMIEPLLNTFVQKGIGSFMKRKLFLAGCDLYDQSKNKDLARIGSKDGSLATIDLSSASDSMAYAIVLELLPSDWVTLLCNWRTGHVTYDNKHLDFELEKFSSMGNGFTFELESLIFYTCALCVAFELGIPPTMVSVYGDDIIVPSECYDSLKALLEFFGFTLNSEKSYSEGPFRESCGGDYLYGIDIRPFYVKDRWTDARIVGFLNFSYLGTSVLDDESREYLINKLSPDHILYGPPGYGDGFIISTHLNTAEFPVPSENPKKPTLHGYFVNSFIKNPKRHVNGLLFIGDDLNPLYQIQHFSPIPIREIFRMSRRRRYELVSAMERRALLSNTKVEPVRKWDPYIVRGDKGSKKVKIYILNKTELF